ncbi:MAG: hypothetical protein NT098_03530 [Candidatus Parcubacteria bacterium]|nr:hypothetical protein [Candidatus Parcubacteria bacterium]
MSRESIYANMAETGDLKEKALLVFDLISRTLYTSLISSSAKNNKKKNG